jgi:hypothetical protein
MITSDKSILSQRHGGFSVARLGAGVLATNKPLRSEATERFSKTERRGEEMKKVVLIGCLIGLAGLHTARAQGAGGSELPAYWGVEAGGGSIWLPKSLSTAIQHQYSASLTGPMFSAGIVRFHPNGAPNFSLQFLHFGLNAQATDLNSASQYTGTATVSGFLASKHVSFIARKRFSFGTSFGAGVGPQLTAHYRQSYSDDGVLAGPKTYALTEVPVTPLFELLFRADIRVHRNVSIAPYAGILTGVPVIGGTVRVHFLRQ